MPAMSGRPDDCALGDRKTKAPEKSAILAPVGTPPRREIPRCTLPAGVPPIYLGRALSGRCTSNLVANPRVLWAGTRGLE